MRGTNMGDWWVERRNHLTIKKCKYPENKTIKKIKIKTAASK